MSALLKGHSIRAFQETPGNIGWRESAYDGRRAYIRCLQDHCMHPTRQDFFSNRSGVKWVVRDLESSHSPFMSVPNQLFKATREIVEEFYAAT